MKFSTLFTTLVLTLPLMAHGTPKLTPANLDRVYLPRGYDSNDNIQIVGEGVFPNTCYRPSNVEVKIDSDARKVFLGPVAFEYPGSCLQVEMPFHRTIEIGVLDSGSWQVVRRSDGFTLGKLEVVRALSESPDDFLYAPISQAYFKQEAGSAQILLTGNLLSSCMRLDDVRLSIFDDVIIVQPIVRLDEGSDCKSGEFPFKSWTAIDFLRRKRYLLHVRSMNGHAVNSLIDAE